MFIFQVQLGDTLELDSPDRSLVREPVKPQKERRAGDLRPEYDSVTGEFIKGREWAIYKSARCKPVYIVAYSTPH